MLAVREGEGVSRRERKRWVGVKGEGGKVEGTYSNFASHFLPQQGQDELFHLFPCASQLIHRPRRTEHLFRLAPRGLLLQPLHDKLLQLQPTKQRRESIPNRADDVLVLAGFERGRTREEGESCDEGGEVGRVGRDGLRGLQSAKGLEVFLCESESNEIVSARAHAGDGARGAGRDEPRRRAISKVKNQVSATPGASFCNGCKNFNASTNGSPTLSNPHPLGSRSTADSSTSCSGSGAGGFFSTAPPPTTFFPLSLPPTSDTSFFLLSSSLFSSLSLFSTSTLPSSSFLSLSYSPLLNASGFTESGASCRPR